MHERYLRNVEFKHNNKTIFVNINTKKGMGLFITDDEFFNRMVFKKIENHSMDKTNNIILPDDTFTYIGEATSYLSGNNITLYYDKTIKDILVTPSLSFLRFKGNRSVYDVSGYSVGGGKESEPSTIRSYPSYATSSSITVPNLPEINTDLNIETYLASFPGLMTPDYTQDANTFEEMLDESINLKRYYRQMMTYIKLGKASEVFKNLENSIPLYLLRPDGVRVCNFDFLGPVKLDPNQILYLTLPF